MRNKGRRKDSEGHRQNQGRNRRRQAPIDTNGMELTALEKTDSTVLAARHPIHQHDAHTKDRQTDRQALHQTNCVTVFIKNQSLNIFF